MKVDGELENTAISLNSGALLESVAVEAKDLSGFYSKTERSF